MTSIFGGGSQLNVSGSLVPQTFSPTNGQMVFTITAFTYTPNSNTLLVFINGQKQIVGTDYTETSSSQFTLVSGVTSDDVVEVVGFPKANISQVVVPDAGVSTAKLQDLSVTTVKLAPNAVTSDKIADDAVGTSEIAPGAVGASELANGAVTGSKLSVTGTADGTKFLRDDMTWASAGRGGAVAVTLTSTSPVATLTATNGQLVIISGDATKAVNPAIILPAMTTLSQSAGYFIFTNLSQYNVAVKDASGAIRQFLAPGANQILNIKDASTSNGIWASSVPALAASSDASNANIFSGWKVNAGWYIMAAKVVKLTTTVFALVWAEYNNGNTVTYYAQPYTVNNTTKVVTQGTRITIGSVTVTATVGVYLSTGSFEITYDTDAVGHALVAISITPNALTACLGGFGVFGLSYSGSTLYSSTFTPTITTIQPACGATGMAKIDAIAYLGSNSAYAVVITLDSGGGGASSATQYLQGYTVTGTTAVTLTASGSNTTVATTATSSHYASRTGLTTFTSNLQGPSAKLCRALNYIPASNTFTVTTRTLTDILDIERGSTRDSCSFAAGGFMYCTGKVYYNGKVWDVTNTGAAGVTGVLSIGYSQKYDFSTAYSTKQGAQAPSILSSIPVSGSSVVGYGASVLSCDPSSSTFNINYSTGSTGDLMLDTTLALDSSITAIGPALSTYTGILTAIPVDVAATFKN